jgi:hypothetical protein
MKNIDVEEQDLRPSAALLRFDEQFPYRVDEQFPYRLCSKQWWKQIV